MSTSNSNYTVTRSGRRYLKTPEQETSGNQKKSLIDTLFIPNNVSFSSNVKTELHNVYTNVLLGILSAFMACSVNIGQGMPVSTFYSLTSSFVTCSLLLSNMLSPKVNKVLYLLFTGSLGISIGTFFTYFTLRPLRENYLLFGCLELWFVTYITKKAYQRTDVSRQPAMFEKNISWFLTFVSSLSLLNAYYMFTPVSYLLFLTVLNTTTSVYLYTDTKRMYRQLNQKSHHQDKLVTKYSMTIFTDLVLLSLSTCLNLFEYLFF